MTEAHPPVSLQGISASLGVARGPAWVVERRRVRVPKAEIDPDRIDGEIQRFRRAITASRDQVEAIRRKIQSQNRDPGQILDAQLLMISDEQIVEGTIQRIQEEHINAEWALVKVLKAIRGLFETVEDIYLRGRAHDVDDVGDRILRNLTGMGGARLDPPQGAIVVAHELSPAEVVQLHRAGVAAVALEKGGRTSHTSLMARAFAMPAVVGLSEVSNQVENGDEIIVDALAGEVILWPDEAQCLRCQQRALQHEEREQDLHQEQGLPSVTRDGVPVRLMGNIELAEEVSSVIDHGGDGVGLYRTEFLYLERETLPTEEDHYRNAVEILESVGDRPVIFRTFDLGGEKGTPGIELLPEANPALGLRSLRLALRERELFRCQLRGLLRASPRGQARIMFPMVSGVDELREARALLAECREELLCEGHPVAEQLQVGIMMELPAAAMTADLLARECDFFSIGTNDLIQYTLGIDRGNAQVGYLYRPLHPAILRTLRFIVSVAHLEGLRVALCGEMAGEPLYTLVLVGLALDELSMPPTAIPHIKRIIRDCDVSEARSFTEELVRLPTVEEVERRVREVMIPRFLDGDGDRVSQGPP